MFFKKKKNKDKIGEINFTEEERKRYAEIGKKMIDNGQVKFINTSESDRVMYFFVASRGNIKDGDVSGILREACKTHEYITYAAVRYTWWAATHEKFGDAPLEEIMMNGYILNYMNQTEGMLHFLENGAVYKQVNGKKINLDHRFERIKGVLNGHETLVIVLKKDDLIIM